MRYIFVIAAFLATTAAESQVKKPGLAGGTLPKQEMELVEACPAGIWFDDRCRGLRFWRSIKPDGTAFAAAFGSAVKAPGEIGSAVLVTIENDAIVHEYHLVGEKRDIPSSREGGLVGTLNEGALPVSVSQHLFEYELLSRVTVTKGEANGYNTIYYEVAVPEQNGDLTLYYSVFREYGPSGRYDEVECTTDAHLADEGLRGTSGCNKVSLWPQNAPSRAGCTKAEDIAAFVVGGIASQGCSFGVGAIASGIALESSAVVFAGVSVESANPFVGAAAGGLTFAAVLGGGQVVKGLYCPAVGAVYEDLVGHATGCVTSGMPATADHMTDIYGGADMLDEFAGTWLASEGTCMRCNQSVVLTVGGAWNEETGEQTVVGELVCTDWDWVEGTDTNNDFFCD